MTSYPENQRPLNQKTSEERELCFLGGLTNSRIKIEVASISEAFELQITYVLSLPRMLRKSNYKMASSLKIKKSLKLPEPRMAVNS